MELLNAIFWEFLQNFPMIILFVLAVWLWAQQRKNEAILCMLMGSTIGALVIRFTEPLISGYVEPIETTIANIVVIGLLQVPFTAYLSSESKWSNWKTDIVGGGLAGAFIAIVQGVASQGSPLIGILLHSVSLAIGSALVLVSVRFCKDKPLQVALGYATGIALAMTLAISLLDYTYLLFV